MELHPLERPAPEAAPALLGWRLTCHGREGRIAEVEAYHGVEDRGCHASRGRTARTEVLFAGAGTLYIYLCYGMHWMLNLVCDPPGVPSAVLIRGIVVDGLDPRHTNGPGKVARFLGLTGRQHGLHLDDPACPLRLLPPRDTRPHRSGPRVGISYAGRYWAGRPWRWWEEGFPAVPVSSAATPRRRDGRRSRG